MVSILSFANSRQSISEPTLKNPHQRQLWDTWRNTWMLAWERQKRLQDKHNYAKELDSLRNFDFDEWRKRVRARACVVSFVIHGRRSIRVT